jgi:hypothetical protein
MPPGVAIIGAIHFGPGRASEPPFAVALSLALLAAAFAVLAMLLREPGQPAAR